MLIVEDNGLMRAALLQFLQSAFPGRAIHDVADGASALAFVRERRPRLVLMDVSLPDANGIELTAEIKAQFPEIRVIVVTQLEGSHYIEHARAAGAYAYVTKDKIYQKLLPLARRVLGVEQQSPASPGTD